MTRRTVLLLGLLGSGWFTLPGCGGESKSLLPVEGRVTLHGKPLAGCAVTFVPLEEKGEYYQAEGETDAQGIYTLKTAGRSGAPAGKYRAIVQTGAADRSQDASFDPQYSNWRKSPLLREVADNAPKDAYDLPLTRKGENP
jgi:hypothetical protein